MEKYFFYDQTTDGFEFFESEQERNQKVLDRINECHIEDGIYDMETISDIKVGVVTHDLQFNITDRLENYEDAEDWPWSPDAETAGEYELTLVQ